MKHTIIVTLIIGMMTMFSANAQQNMDKFMVQVDGLGCPFCAFGLEKKFKEFKGIKTVKIDIETGDFSFSYPAEKALSLADVEKQVENAGYTPITTKIERANGKVEVSKATSLSEKTKGTVTKNVMVAGNCGMCEARISKAAKSVAGVSEISWNKDTKMMKVSFDVEITTLSEIEMAIAKSGHDTKNQKAQTATYNDLPPCCLYERMAK
ncbi:MAG: cation transporter [Cellulophaga sp.]|nr:cation transporter [Cellulophaga sp.]